MIVKKSISCRTSTCSQGHQQRLAVDPNITADRLSADRLF
jgi:hypothetical protein